MMSRRPTNPILPPRRRPAWVRWAILAGALVVAAALIQAVLIVAHDSSPVVVKTRSEAAAARPTEDPGITACRNVTQRMDRTKAGGPPPSDAERAEARALLARSAHPDLREVGRQLEATKNGNLYEQAEASGALLRACMAAGIQAGLTD
jgi:hypothetical protein